MNNKIDAEVDATTDPKKKKNNHTRVNMIYYYIRHWG